MRSVRCTAPRLLRFTAAVLLLALGLGVFSAVAVSDTVFSEDFEGSFSVCPSGWQVLAGEVSRTTDHAAGGSASVMIRDASAKSSASLISPSVRQTAGLYYRITVDGMNHSR